MLLLSSGRAVDLSTHRAKYHALRLRGPAVQETRYSKNLHAIKRRYDKEISKLLNKLGKAFNCCVETSGINTRDPWLNVMRSNNKWRVTDGNGKFETRDKYHNREQAMTVLHRHCKAIELPVSMYLINDALREHAVENGLPLFGETLYEKV